MQDSVRNQLDTSSAPAGGAAEAEVYVFPTTVAQRRFWLLDELAPGNPALNVPLAARLKGPVDVEVMQRAVNEILRRHEILRSSFRMVDDELVQVAPPSSHIELRRYDISDIPESQREARIQELMLEEGHRKFVLAEGPFLQAAIAKVSDEEHVLMLMMHHIACDGWSNGILMREVAQLYTALMRNEPPPDDLPLQYADFALWQQDWLAGEGAQEQERFWLNRLQGKLSYLNLPTDRPRRSGRSHPGAIETRLLSRELGDSIKAYCNREDLTPFMVFFSAFGILLSRYSGRRDIVVGSPAANRGQTELESLIGLFANPLLLRLNLDGNPTLSGLVARVKELALGAFAHQAYPFERLMETLELEPNRAGLQWLQAYFVFQKAFMVPQEFHGGTLIPLRSISPGSMFEWMLGVLERSEGFRLQLEYNTDLFDAETIATMLEQLELLLGRLVREPGTRLDSIDILTPRERELFVQKPGQQRLRLPSGQRAHELFEEQVRLQPSQTALAGAGRNVSYASLNSWANRLALELRQQGVGPETIVALDLPQDSAEFVVATLAVLKAGGACAVAVSPDLDLARGFKSLPAERRPQCAITRAARFSEWSGAAGTVLAVVPEDPSDTTSPTPNLSNIVLGDQPAWIRCLSAADGTLRSHCFAHKALLNRVLVDSQLFGLSPSDRLPATADHTLSALVAGAALVTGMPDPSKGFRVWLDWAERGGVRVAFLSEDTLEAYAREGAERQLPLPKPLRLLATGPIPVSPSALSWWTSGTLRLVSLLETPDYLGPVQWGEASVSTPGLSQLKLGRPVSNVRVLVLDDLGQPVPAGVPGWIHVAGEGLATTPEGSSESGVASHWLARYDRAGGLEIVGERGVLAATPGFRLEWKEIQSVICEHAGVFSVRLNMVRSGDRSELIALVVAKPGLSLTGSELRDFVRSRLPEYMVPSKVWVQSAFEISASGRFRLDTPVQEEATGSAEAPSLDGPTNDVERALCEIWAGVFRVDRVGIHENFFELGGDSILTLQVISKASQKGIRLAPRVIWQNPTIASLAKATGGAAAAAQSEQGAVSGSVPLSPIQRWFFGHSWTKIHQWNQAALLDVGAGVTLEQFRTVLSALVQHHDALRLRFFNDSGTWEQANDAREANALLDQVTIEAADEAQRDVALHASYDAVHASLNIEDGPLVRARWHNLGPSLPARVLLVIHHLAVDGVSWRVLLEDLEQALGQVRQGRPIQLPPKTTSFKAWAERLVRYGSSTELLEEADYWQGILKQSGRGLQPDVPAGRNIESATFKVASVFETEESRRLLTETPVRFQAQIHELLLYALGRALKQRGGEGGVILDLEGHGREDLFEGVDISRTLGWFTTIYPFHLDVSGATTPESGIRKVRDDLRQIPNKGFGFSALKYLSTDSSLRESLGSWPKGQIVFNYLGQLDAAAGDGMVRRVWGFNGTGRAGENARTHLLEINAHISEGRLKVNWTFSSEAFRVATIESLAAAFCAEVRGALGLVQATAVPQKTVDADRSSETPSVVETIPVAPASKPDKFPLSPMQRLFHTMAQSGGGYGFEQFRFRIRGALDADRFREACFQVFQRHSALRSSIVVGADGEPFQVEHPGAVPEWRVEDWRGTTGSALESRLSHFVGEDRRQGFDLAQAPLQRFALLRLGDEEWEWVWSFHHVLMDGWSWPIVYREITALYDAAVNGQHCVLPPAAPFSDYIQWLDRQDPAKERLYWKRCLKGIEEPTPLRTGVSADSGHGEAGAQAEEFQSMDPALFESLAALAKSAHVTLHSVIEAAWALTLAHVCGRRDVVFGETVSGRPAEIPGVDSIVGMFINNLPRRVSLDEAVSVEQFLKELQAGYLEMSDYQYSSPVQIQEWCRIPGRHRLFNTLLLVQNYSRERAGTGGIHPLRDASSSGGVRTNYPITLMVVPGGQGHIKLYYQTGVVDAALASAYLRCVSTALKELSASSGRTVGEVLKGLPVVQTGFQDVTRPGGEQRAVIEPRSKTEHLLAELWKELLGLEHVSVDRSFFDLGGHSVVAVRMFARVEKLTGKRLPLVTLFEAKTIEQLARILETEGWQPRWTSLVPIKASGTRPPFYCVHGVGGNILEFEHIQRYIDEDQPLYGIQAQGLDGLKPRHGSVEEMATHYIGEILEFQPQGPYFLGGSSFGGLVAFEAARQLEAMGHTVGLVVMFDTYAPGYPQWLPGMTKWKRIILRQQLRWDLHYSNLKVAQGREKWDYVWTKFARMIDRLGKRPRMAYRNAKKSVSEWLHPKAIRAVREAGHKALKKYDAVPAPIRVTLMRATEQPKGILEDRANGWTRFALGGVDVHDVAGHHGSIMREPRVKRLVELLNGVLRRANTTDSNCRKNSDAFPVTTSHTANG